MRSLEDVKSFKVVNDVCYMAWEDGEIASLENDGLGGYSIRTIKPIKETIFNDKVFVCSDRLVYCEQG